MSSYITIKKDKIPLNSWCRSSYIYQALQPQFPYTEVDREFTRSDIKLGIENAQEEIKSYEKSIKKYNKMLEGNLSYEERSDTLDAICEAEEEIDGLKRAIYDLQFIDDCIEFDDYYEYYDEEKETKKEKPKWYYIYE